MNATEILGYTFQADTYCPGCIGATMTPQGSNTVTTWDAERTLTALALAANINRMDESSYDSDTFPKVIFGDQVHSGDGPDYCGRCHELLAPYECELCGDEHGESAHGETPLVQRDQGSRSITDAVAVYVLDAMALTQDGGKDGEFQRLASLYDDWNAQTDGERDEYAPEYLDDIDAILHDAGYLPITNGDQGTWSVYGPAMSTDAHAVTNLPTIR